MVDSGLKEFVLMLDTSIQGGIVSILTYSPDQNRYVVIESRCVEENQRASRSLIPLIDELLRNANCLPNMLDRIAVATGPGSFTGIKLGLSTVLGMVQGLSVHQLKKGKVFSDFSSMLGILKYISHIQSIPLEQIEVVLPASRTELYSVRMSSNCNVIYSVVNMKVNRDQFEGWLHSGNKIYMIGTWDELCKTASSVGVTINTLNYDYWSNYLKHDFVVNSLNLIWSDSLPTPNFLRDAAPVAKLNLSYS